MTKIFSLFRVMSKDGLTPLRLGHIILGVLGISLVSWSLEFRSISAIGQIMFLVWYLTSLVGMADLPVPGFKTNAGLVRGSGIGSGFLDSFIILLKLRTVDISGSEESRDKLLALSTQAALIGGLYLWFGEIYAAPLYNSHHLTGPLSALFVVPPIMLFLWILGLQASSLDAVITNSREIKWQPRPIFEFVIGITLLLLTHNSMLCMGILLIYALLTSQMDLMERIWRQDTEISVIGVLAIAWCSGEWISSQADALSLSQGTLGPIALSSLQAILWAPLYSDNVNFWIMMTNLSTGAMLLPTSSLVGVVIFKTSRQWWAYLKTSLPNALLWFCLMRTWIWFNYQTDLGRPLGEMFDFLARIWVSSHH